jgi:hypothetical protein
VLVWTDWLQLVSVPWAAVWLLCRLCMNRHWRLVVTGALVDGLRLQCVSGRRAVVVDVVVIGVSTVD